jgi:hypothetical protein
MGCGSSVQSQSAVGTTGVETTKQQANDEDLAISTLAQTRTVLPPATPKRLTLFDFLFAKTLFIINFYWNCVGTPGNLILSKAGTDANQTS